ncbi:hypothetical protein SLEP1_g25440 [Rubroshorea leprosula]|uniref:Uncharacterized protein n=1 Tax=Rubroshorea leprosula TaxID=152421 RepID=A0AAV5JLZ7_9ROSI|nr:hypothetical protein SLEP1_g25440 [Rubroshorea leprosula]
MSNSDDAVLSWRGLWALQTYQLACILLDPTFIPFNVFKF